MKEIILKHFQRYPGLELADMYKLVYQASMGCEHAILNEESVRGWMNQELEEMGSGPDESLAESISPDGRIVRVHLRPYVAAGRSINDLLDAFINTARLFEPSKTKLNQYLTEMKSLVSHTGFPYSENEVSIFLHQIEEKGYPVLHHSKSYISLYRPVYRVVLKQLL